MNPNRFDECIQIALDHHPQLIGSSAQLLRVDDYATPNPPGDWISVTMLIETTTLPWIGEIDLRRDQSHHQNR